MKTTVAFLIALMLAPLPLFAGAVQTDGGLVEGVRAGPLTVYKGIAFAAPPVVVFTACRCAKSSPASSS
jgi:hypothetical protein